MALRNQSKQSPPTVFICGIGKVSCYLLTAVLIFLFLCSFSAEHNNIKSHKLLPAGGTWRHSGTGHRGRHRHRWRHTGGRRVSSPTTQWVPPHLLYRLLVLLWASSFSINRHWTRRRSYQRGSWSLTFASNELVPCGGKNNIWLPLATVL